MGGWGGDTTGIDRWVRGLFPPSVLPGLKPIPWPAQIEILAGPRPDIAPVVATIDAAELNAEDVAAAVRLQVEGVLEKMPQNRSAATITVRAVYTADTGTPDPPPAPFTREFARANDSVVPAALAPGNPFPGLQQTFAAAVSPPPPAALQPSNQGRHEDPFGAVEPTRVPDNRVDPHRPMDMEAVRLGLNMLSGALEASRLTTANLMTQVTQIMGGMVASSRADAERHAADSLAIRTANANTERMFAEAAKERDMLRARTKEYEAEVSDLEEELDEFRDRADRAQRKLRRRRRQKEQDPAGEMFNEVTDRVLKQVDAMISARVGGGGDDAEGSDDSGGAATGVAGDPTQGRKRKRSAKGGGAPGGLAAIMAGGKLPSPEEVADMIALAPGEIRDAIVSKLVEKHPQAGVGWAESLVKRVEDKVETTKRERRRTRDVEDEEDDESDPDDEDDDEEHDEDDEEHDEDDGSDDEDDYDDYDDDTDDTDDTDDGSDESDDDDVEYEEDDDGNDD